MTAQDAEKARGDGKAVLLTGCSSGIGRESALALAEQGYTVLATVRRQAAADALRDLRIPGLVPVCPVDMADAAQVSQAASSIAQELGRRGLGGLHALVNNAGGGGPAPVELMDPEVFHTELKARLIGPVILIQAILPLLRRAQGRIVWIMTPGLFPTPYVASIHACDFAANCLARTLDIELKSWGIPCVMIRCGGIRTPAGLRTVADVESLLKSASPERVALYETPLRRWTEEMTEFDRKRTDPKKVADAVVTAVGARRPKRRYSVGYMAGAAAVLEALPQSLADRILKSRF